MKTISFTFLACLSFIFVPGAYPQTRTRTPERETPVIEELRKISPNSVDAFIAATESMDNGSVEEAERLFNEVLKKAPDFEPALRRLGYTYVALGRRDEGLVLTKKAIDKNRSVDNLVARASTLITSNDPNFKPSFNETSEATLLATEAWKKSGETDEGAGSLLADLLLQSQQIAEAAKLATKLKSTFPDRPSSAAC